MMYYQNIVSILFVDLASTTVWYDLDISMALLAKQTTIALLWPVEKTIPIPISKQWKCWICNNGADLVHGHNGCLIVAIHKEYCWSLMVVPWMSWDLYPSRHDQHHCCHHRNNNNNNKNDSFNDWAWDNPFEVVVMMMMAVAVMTCSCQVENPHIRHDPIDLYDPTN